MKQASRTIGVIGGGVVGMMTAGPVGAYAGGIAGGVALDGITTSAEYLIHNEYKPSGLLLTIDQI